jgi:hypothetical protein
MGCAAEQAGLDVFPNRSDESDDRNPVRRNEMNNTEAENNAGEPNFRLSGPETWVTECT